MGGGTATTITKGVHQSRRDITGKVVEALLVLALVGSLLILLVLLVDLVRRSWPVWTDGAGEFISGPLTSANAEQAGIWQGIKGTLLLGGVVAVVALPLGVACAEQQGALDALPDAGLLGVGRVEWAADELAGAVGPDRPAPPHQVDEQDEEDQQ